LLPHLLTVCEHAQRLGSAGEQVGWLLGRASTYLHERGLYAQALPLAERAVTATEVALGSGHVDLGWRIDELVLQRQLGERGASSAVVTPAGLLLASSAPS